MTDIKQWTVTLEEDPETGELILPFPPEMLIDLDWNEGDILLWNDNKDGTFSLTKKKEDDSTQT
jgi:hypothetical protein